MGFHKQRHKMRRYNLQTIFKIIFQFVIFSKFYS